MLYEKLKKGIVSLALAAAFVVGIGSFGTANAQGRGWDGRRYYERSRRWDRDWDRDWERRHFDRIRRLDYQRQLRWQFGGGNRYVGYCDRWGRFHAFGFYDRFGRFHSFYR
jgi:hypothetical protein